MSTGTVTLATVVPLASNESTRVNLGLTMDALVAAVPLQYMHFTLSSPQPLFNLIDRSPSGISYDYTVKAADNRVWSQKMVFADSKDPNPTMTFQVTQGWRLSEFVPQRALRDLLVQMVVNFGATVIKYDYT